MPDIGVVDADAVAALGVVGLAARAAGVPDDVRATSPALAYDGFEPAALRRPAGDVQARLEQRALELLPCLDILDRLLDGTRAPVRRGGRSGGEARRPRAGSRARAAPRAASSSATATASAGVHLRTGSYANWPAVAHAAATNLLPDFPLINKSFELCYACVDR